jgi:hypothetical protein
VPKADTREQEGDVQTIFSPSRFQQDTWIARLISAAIVPM